jgi:hypothetical protein
MMIEYVYLFKGCDIAEGLYKIGISNDVEYRLQSFAGYPFAVVLLVKFPVIDSEKVETLVHNALHSYHYRAEWFRLNADIVNLFLKSKNADDLLASLGVQCDFFQALGDAVIVSDALSKNVFAHLMRLQQRNRRIYKAQDIMSVTGISRPVVNSIIKAKSFAYSDSTLSGLLTFFANEGMPVKIDDLFVTLPAVESEPPR